MRAAQIKRVDLPLKASTRDQQPPIWDQGELGACTGFGINRAMAYLMGLAGVGALGGERPAPLFTYYNEREMQGTVDEDSGATIRTGVKAVAQFGVCRESLWPYVVDKFKNEPPCAAYDDGADHQAIKYERIPVRGLVRSSLDGVRSALAEGFPVVCGIQVYESFEKVGADGIVPLPAKGEACLGGHCICIVGYEIESKDELFTAANSWGEAWGDHGYFHAPAEYFKRYGSDFWTIKQLED